jgi:catechol 2,3-dioxygenase-like lactoylglutathione lyase family enzyme
MRASAIWHVGLTVSDLDAAIHFYRDLLGFELVARRMVDPELAPALSGIPEATIEIAFLDLPGSEQRDGSHDLELVHYHRPVEAGAAGYVSTPGSPHLAIVVDDALAAHAELAAAGVVFVSPPNLVASGPRAGAYLCYFRGPDAIVHELFQPPPIGSSVPPHGTRGTSAAQRA